MLVVSPNLCFDRTLHVEAFQAGSVVRPHTVRVRAGGKGVNVVRTLADLGRAARLLGFVADQDGDHFTALAAGEGLDLVAVPVGGELRCATIVLERSGRATVLNEPGPATDASDADRLLEAAEAALARGAGGTDGADVVVGSGSLPPGLPADTYGRLVGLARDRGAVSVVDTHGAAMSAALGHGPDVVTPNLHEAEALLRGRVEETSHEDAPLDDVRDRAVAAARELLGLGPRRALVTAGAHGAAYDDGRTSLWVTAPQVQARNPIGAGDSLVGGLAAALAAGAGWPAAVRRAVAVASAAVESEHAGRVDADRANVLAEQVGVA